VTQKVGREDVKCEMKDFDPSEDLILGLVLMLARSQSDCRL